MWVNSLISIGIIYVLYLVRSAGSSVVKYLPNIDFTDRRNWLNKAPQKECNGLVLEPFHGTTSFKTLEVKQIVFGKQNEILLNEDTDIVFDSNTKSEMNCVTINETEVNNIRKWVSINNWIKTDKENNSAVPHLERLPCVYDEVVFPKGYLSGTVVVSKDVTIKSLKFGDENWGEQELIDRDQDEILRETIIFLNSARMKISNNPCDSDSGCLCGNELYNSETCYHIEKPEETNCDQPILPLGFCHEICGATIFFKPDEDFQIKHVQTKLKAYLSDSYVSKVKNSTGEIVIQIIFTEKQFTGNSIKEAIQLYQELQNDKTVQVKEALFLASSYPKQKGSTALNAVSIILGSLFVAGVIFAVTLFIFGENEKSRQFRERIGLGTKPLSYKTVFFSRSSVSEGAGLIIEGQSIAGSITNIPKTFENPTFSEFQNKSSSTSSSNTSSAEDLTTEARQIEKESKSTEPIMFEESRRHLIEKVAEEGELVDLSDMN